MEDCSGLLAEIRNAIQRGEIESIAACAGSLPGLLDSIGDLSADRAARGIAEELELGETAAVRRELNWFKQEYRRLIPRLKLLQI